MVGGGSLCACCQPWQGQNPPDGGPAGLMLLPPVALGAAGLALPATSPHHPRDRCPVARQEDVMQSQAATGSIQPRAHWLSLHSLSPKPGENRSAASARGFFATATEVGSALNITLNIRLKQAVRRFARRRFFSFSFSHSHQALRKVM